MNGMPLVSVIIPCYNCEPWISATLKSVVEQTYSNLEIIVIDDGSTDNTKLEIEKSGVDVRYYYKKNKGPAAARNLGIVKATGKYIAFLDSDDLWEKNKTEEQLKVIFDNENQIDLVFSNVSLIDEVGSYLYTHYNNVPDIKKDLIVDLFLGKIGMNTPTILVKKEILEDIGGFDEELPLREDHFLLMEIADKYNIYHIKTPLVRRRKTKTSMSVSVDVDKIKKLNMPFIQKSIQKFSYLKPYQHIVLSKLNTAIAMGYWKSQEKKKSLKSMMIAIRLNPKWLRSYFVFLAILFGINYSAFEKVKNKVRKSKL